jgi:hypothetical protein
MVANEFRANKVEAGPRAAANGAKEATVVTNRNMVAAVVGNEKRGSKNPNHQVE